MLCADVVNGLGDTAVVVFRGFSRPSPTSQFFAYVAMFAFNVFGGKSGRTCSRDGTFPNIPDV